MLFRTSVLAVTISALLAGANSADAGARKRFVTPVFVPPDHVVLEPINPPLDGVFLTSPARCPSRTMYYFNGRFADRPDFFYIRRH